MISVDPTELHSIYQMRQCSTLGVVVVVVAACSDSVVELGLIEVPDIEPFFDAPSPVGVGQPLMVIVTTFGGGCTELERTDVETFSDGADVFPFDRTLDPGDSNCPASLQSFTHTAMVSFDAAGEKTIRFYGRVLSSQSPKVYPLTIVVE